MGRLFNNVLIGPIEVMDSQMHENLLENAYKFKNNFFPLANRLIYLVHINSNNF